MTVSELNYRMSVKEMISWQAYDLIEPFGEDRADLRMGILASVMANVNRKRNSKAFKPSQFIPKFWKEVKDKPTLEGLALIAERLKRRLSR